MSRRGESAAAALALVACVAAAFSSALAGRGVFFERDVLAYWYPQVAVLRRAVAEGSWPLWNPWLGFGAPVLADASYQLAYPPAWLALVLPPQLQFAALAVGHSLLAAAGACALARAMGLGWRGGAVAGVGYGLSGPLVSAVSLFHHHAGAAWVPWLLWALATLLARPVRARALRLGLLGGVQVFAGSGDLLLCAGVLGGLMLAAQLARSRPAGRALWATLAGLAGAALLALAVGAVQWLPTAARAAGGFRVHQDPRTSGYWSLHPLSAADLVVPRLVSELPVGDGWRARLNEGREPLLGCIYLGVVTAGLALLALAGPGRGPVAAFAAGLGFFLVASLGRHAPLHGLLLSLPGFGLMRYPQKFLLPAALCLAVLAGAGAHAWSGEWSPRQRRRALALAAGLALAAVALVGGWALLGWRPQPLARLGVAAAGLDAAAHTAGLKLARSALLALLFAGLLQRRARAAGHGFAPLAVLLLAGALDAVAVARGAIPLAPAEIAEHRPAVLGKAGVDPGTRVHAADEGGACLTPAGGPRWWPPAWRAALAFQDTLRPPAPARWGVRGSFDGEFTGLGSPWEAALSEIVHADLADGRAQKLLRLAGVQRVLRVGRAPVPGLEPVAILASPYACPLQVLAVEGPLPGAYVVHAARAASGVQATVAALLEQTEPDRSVLLEPADVEAGPAAGAGEPAATTPAATRPAATSLVHPGAEGLREAVHWVARRTDELELAVELRSAGWLVLSEAYDPGWKAWVDGRPERVLRANGIFRALRLGAGRHRVRLAYRPWSAALGAALSLAGLAAAVALALPFARRRRRLPASDGGDSIPAGMGRA